MAAFTQKHLVTHLVFIAGTTYFQACQNQYDCFTVYQLFSCTQAFTWFPRRWTNLSPFHVAPGQFVFQRRQTKCTKTKEHKYIWSTNLFCCCFNGLSACWHTQCTALWLCPHQAQTDGRLWRAVVCSAPESLSWKTSNVQCGKHKSFRATP